MNNIKQVIVIRKDLHMRLGKSCSQAAHATMKVILDLMFDTEDNRNNLKFKTLCMEKGKHLDQWINGIFKKIVVYVNSEQELLEIYNKATEQNLPRSLIQDAGQTEFNGVSTYTCCAIGPGSDEEIDKITGELPLL